MSAEIYYYDIGDYLSRDEKLRILDDFGSMENLPFTRITPNEHGDWISKRNDKFSAFIPMEAAKKFDRATQSFFTTYAIGVATNRDAWVYNFSRNELEKNMTAMIDFYNEQRNVYQATVKNSDKKIDVSEIVKNDANKISWTRGIKKLVERNIKIETSPTDFISGMYRPFQKMNYCSNDGVIEMPGLSKKLFPTPQYKNLVITLSCVGSTKPLSAIITDTVPDLHLIGDSQCFPLYWYEEAPSDMDLFQSVGIAESKYIRHDAISDFILNRAQTKYGNKVTKEDLFYYVYGILHSKSYRQKFADDLKKMLPRIPLVSDYNKFWAFSKAGRELAKLHLDYESVPPCKDVKVERLNQAIYKMPETKYESKYGELVAADSGASNTKENSTSDDYEYYAVQQMKFPKKGEKGTIIYNHWHTVTNIPPKAYEYVVNGKSAIEWIMERYAVTTDKKSGIVNNPNDWAKEHQKPRYILDLLLSVINVSVQTVDIVDALPEVDWEKE